MNLPLDPIMLWLARLYSLYCPGCLWITDWLPEVPTRVHVMALLLLTLKLRHRFSSNLSWDEGELGNGREDATATVKEEEGDEAGVWAILRRLRVPAAPFAMPSGWRDDISTGEEAEDDYLPHNALSRYMKYLKSVVYKGNVNGRPKTANMFLSLNKALEKKRSEKAVSGIAAGRGGNGRVEAFSCAKDEDFKKGFGQEESAEVGGGNRERDVGLCGSMKGREEEGPADSYRGVGSTRKRGKKDLGHLRKTGGGEDCEMDDAMWLKRIKCEPGDEDWAHRFSGRLLDGNEIDASGTRNGKSTRGLLQLGHSDVDGREARHKSEKGRDDEGQSGGHKFPRGSGQEKGEDMDQEAEQGKKSGASLNGLEDVAVIEGAGGDRWRMMRREPALRGRGRISGAMEMHGFTCAPLAKTLTACEKEKEMNQAGHLTMYGIGGRGGTRTSTSGILVHSDYFVLLVTCAAWIDVAPRLLHQIVQKHAQALAEIQAKVRYGIPDSLI
eukprot:TRINITY_DN1398_c0_g4_i1.p1 TRINITY_DN1398_c0_g4~~TRINITY_DN1398_c0_g4_i1.p1  ORF type:complete len:497 (+),score=65.26 TRINITY_DN1398_c0_g4_i1:1108-2598(+)